MENKMDVTKQIVYVENQIDRIISSVIERGIDDIVESIDDYSILIENVEFKTP